jgi:hypothetical protein
MACISLDPVFDLTIHVMQVCLSYLPKTPFKAYRDRMTEDKPNASVRTIHIERLIESFEELTFDFVQNP